MGVSPPAAGGRLRLVAVGCGRVFERFHFPALLRSGDWTLAAAVDRSADRLRWIGGLVPDALLAGGLGELPTELRADAILVCTPPDSHCPIAGEALRRGMHVLVEKPLTLQADEAASLVQLARGVGRQIWVGYNRRFRPGYGRLRARLAAPHHGTVRGVTYELRSDPAAWAALSGEAGVLDDIASHQLDLVPWLVNREVEAVRARPAHEAGGSAAEIELRLSGGVSASCRAVHAPGPRERLEIRLADRTLLADPSTVASAQRLPRAAVEGYLTGRNLAGSVLRKVRGLPGYGLETFGHQLAAWASALRGGSPGAAADGEAGARCVRLVEACRQSMAVGGAWIRVSRGIAT